MTLSLNDYQQLSKRTMPRHDTQHAHREALFNYTLGLVGEGGEFSELIKKELCHDHPQSHIDKVKELGDVLHYLAGLATLLEVDLETVARVNIEKLEKRYSNGFSTQASIERVDVPRCNECLSTNVEVKTEIADGICEKMTRCKDCHHLLLEREVEK